ncbi:MAG: HlyC/CorC family transporter [Actinobacteria bacterium]|jgi:CBS domain containing-hemolysin-like protein|nr:HlyC/CorC family transporter [Micrococcales bacterium]MCB0902665.1 HlyC/CorC family transporter [Actinomycetota bacterium]HRV65963.1 hemolysin family protein [Candidatus Nanopelagicales bacterium]MCB9429966.1 HlyC/CorC family transporter [Actinomycetota bacterium]HPE10989.1 hemolysin family protein [Actinomycetota bacterium]
MEYADIAFQVVAVVLLVAVAGVLVASEVAITRVSKPRAEELVEEGVRGAAGLQVIVGDRPRYVNVLLFLRLVCTTSAIAIATLIGIEVIDAPRWWQMGLAVAVMVFVGYVVTGVAPRTLAQQHAEPIALAASGPARFLAGLLGPLTSLLILLGNAITPGKGYRQGPFVSQAELRELLDQAGADSVIEDDERQMLHSVFELGDTLAREVMVPRTEMVWIEADKTLRQALSLGLRSGFSRIPVIAENLDDVVGVVYLKDVARRIFEDRGSERNEHVDTVMREAHFIPDSKRADDLLRDMQAARVHMSIVVDEYGGTAGLVTIEDILEEIVGEITDEYDNEVPEVEELATDRYRVSARLGVDDLAELVPVQVSSEGEDVDTVGGLLGRRLGVVPIPGTHVDIDGYRLTAERAAGRRNRVGTVLVEKLQSSEVE